MMKSNVKHEENKDHFVNRFMDDFCSLVSRFLVSSQRRRVDFVPAPPSVSSVSKPTATGVVVYPETGLDAVNTMLQLMDQAKPRVTADQNEVDFATESAVFLLRFRSLLEKHLNEEQKIPLVLPTKTINLNNSSSSSNDHSENENRCNSDRRINPHKRILRRMYSFPNESVSRDGSTNIFFQKIGVVDAECQTDTSGISVNSQLNGLSTSEGNASLKSTSCLRVAQSQLILVLQQHTTNSILSLDMSAFELKETPAKKWEYELLIQTRYVEGIHKELKKERNRLYKQHHDGLGMEEQESLHYREIEEVIGRLEMAVVSVDYAPIIEEFQDSDRRWSDTIEQRSSSGVSNKDDLNKIFGHAGVGFVSKLVVQNVHCFLTVLTCGSSFPHRWVYLEKVLFLTDSVSPVPTVPMEIGGAPSPRLSGTGLDRSPSRNPSASPALEEEEEEEQEEERSKSRKNSVAPEQKRDLQLRELVQRFSSCHAYEEVQRHGALLGVSVV
ncbi:uncharacterized protein TM35_000091950 [Trypanosoma theileri]|uniref:Uncharacterized protein n=1 Tax=Trypanosoma theileri TaxID=67003 RepID=A0A1X0NZN7_9TRYP|nr:uncharacterized protein TM35_000091950 [Trypanosoma theileri]ORC90145.1 hypothetical protein TM35_000091950 [Trypanosoma theileri]